jgi:hypothetical protein
LGQTKEEAQMPDKKRSVPEGDDCREDSRGSEAMYYRVEEPKRIHLAESFAALLRFRGRTFGL